MSLRKAMILALTGSSLILAGCAGMKTPQTEKQADPQRYASAIHHFEHRDRKQMPPRGAIVVAGSSSIRRWHSVRQDLAPLTVIPRGFGGSTMSDLLYYSNRIILPYQPRAVVIYEGDNDIGEFNATPHQVSTELSKLISRIHSQLPDTRIYVISVKPTLERWQDLGKQQQTNQLYRQIASSNPEVHYINAAAALMDKEGNLRRDVFVSDGLHLNRKGTALWAAAIRRTLMPAEQHYEKQVTG